MDSFSTISVLYIEILLRTTFTRHFIVSRTPCYVGKCGNIYIPIDSQVVK